MTGVYPGTIEESRSKEKSLDLLLRTLLVTVVLLSVQVLAKLGPYLSPQKRFLAPSFTPVSAWAQLTTVSNISLYEMLRLFCIPWTPYSQFEAGRSVGCDY